MFGPQQATSPAPRSLSSYIQNHESYCLAAIHGGQYFYQIFHLQNGKSHRFVSLGLHNEPVQVDHIRRPPWSFKGWDKFLPGNPLALESKN